MASLTALSRANYKNKSTKLLNAKKTIYFLHALVDFVLVLNDAGQLLMSLSLLLLWFFCYSNNPANV